MKHSVTASAPGKINIFFSVGSLLPDQYHDVASVYFALDLREKVTATISDSWQVSVAGRLSSAQLEQVPIGEDNLVIRAAKKIADASDAESLDAIHFQIDKHVPVSGGMGGGSADAAAAIMAADELWQSGVSGEKLFELAAEVGADIPFALLGGVAIGLSRGHQLKPVDSVKKFYWVLVTNDQGLSTPEVYSRLDLLREQSNQDPRNQPQPNVPPALIEALQSGDAKNLAPFLQNDLQEAALAIRPELQQTIDAGLEAGALAAIVSGSGPTIAMLVESSDAARTVADKLAIAGHLAITATGPAAGTILEHD
jgi:4-diphosphocytidyl-2-C-methyl-D-erythritol kinase